MGSTPPGRTVNKIYFYFLISLIYLTLVMFFKLKKTNKKIISFSKWVKSLLIISICIYLTGDKEHKNNVRNAYNDLIRGNAYRYDLELKNRYKIILNSKNDTCRVPLLKDKPQTIFSYDITDDPENWKNRSFGAYYHPKKVIIGIKKPNSK